MSLSKDFIFENRLDINRSVSGLAPDSPRGAWEREWTAHLLYGGPLLGSLRSRHNGRYSVSNHQPHDCLLNRLFRRRSKKTSKLRVTGLCAGNSPGTGEFPAHWASNAKNVSIWWRHHACISKRLSVRKFGMVERNLYWFVWFIPILR